MRLLLALLLILGFATPAAAESLVRIEGKNFIAPDGRPLSIKGISLGNWLMPEGYMFKFEVAKSPRQIFSAFDRLLGSEHAAGFWTEFRDTYIARDDIRFIKSVGFNTVRIPLHYRLFMTDQGEMKARAGRCSIACWMGARIWPFRHRRLHAAPGGQTGINHDDGPGYPLTFYVPRDRELTVKLWRAIAQRYSGDPAILGYDILNEPIAPYHDTATLNMRLEPFYRQVTQAIREVDPGRIVILAGGQWSSSFDMLGPPFADNLAYTYHLFWASTQDALSSAISTSPIAMTCRCSWARPASSPTTGTSVSWPLSGGTRHRLGVLDVQEFSTRLRPWCRSRCPTAGRRSWPSPTVRERTSPPRRSLTVPSRSISTASNFRNGVVRWSYLASLGLKAAP